MYLGAAPGVGKTYAMLGEGRRRAERGTDVVVGFVETHGRRHTAEMLDGLEVVPRHTLPYRDSSYDEMDVDAVLARRPRLALIDELAHTNVPGSRNAKRWQDVQEILDAGIDVITTVNIQHLESVNDVVEKITGVPQRETVPDAVVRAAEQIELEDMTAEALRRRLAHGNVYAPEKVDAALANYFRVGNLNALRELALLWTADRVDAALQQYREQHEISGIWEARERVVVALSGGPEGETLLRRAARVAVRAGGELLAVHVAQVRRSRRCQRGRPGRAAPPGREPRRQLPPGARRRRGRVAALVRPRRERDPAGARRQPTFAARCVPQRTRHRHHHHPRVRGHRRAHGAAPRGRRRPTAAADARLAEPATGLGGLRALGRCSRS